MPLVLPCRLRCFGADSLPGMRTLKIEQASIFVVPPTSAR